VKESKNEKEKQWKPLIGKEEENGDLMFLPHLNSCQSDSPYSLYFAPYNIFMFMKFFFSIYERIL